MRLELEQKFNEILNYLHNKEKYREQFIKLVRDNLFDFSIILIWKIFILFLYEKFYQIAQQIGEDVFIQKWEGKFNRKPKNYRKENLYWANEEPDDQIVSFLGVIYKIDSNFLRQADALRKKRDTASHVAELKFTEEDVDNYIFETLRIIEKLQLCHEEEYLSKIEDSLQLTRVKPSQKDLVSILNKMVESLAQASTFRSAEDYENRILQFKENLTKEHIEKILDVVFDNPYSINQVLEAGRSITFFKELYELGKVNKSIWKKFAKKLSENYKGRDNFLSYYNWLFEVLGMPTYQSEIKVR